MKKIYLAKSNRSNPDYVQKVRGIIQDYNCEIVEYKGGGFSHRQMLECDMLIVVPDLTRHEKDDGGQGIDTVGVGKGLFQQVEVYLDTYGDERPIYIVHDCDNGWDPNISTLDTSDDDWGEVDDPNDYIDYGWLYIKPTCDMYENLSTIIGEFFGELSDEDLGERISRRKHVWECGKIIYPKQYLLIGK